MEEAKPCVATIGFFDGVHRGHCFLIDQVKEVAAERGLASCLISFPVHPRKVMQADYQPQLLSTYDEKRARLLRTGIDHCVMLTFTRELSELSAYDFMKNVLRNQLNVKVLVVGYDHRFGHNRCEGFADYVRYGEELGMDVIQAKSCAPDGINVSSSVIRKFLLQGDVRSANKCLGYDYQLEGRVVDGCKVGRTLGFPTANVMESDPDKLIPANGVYAVWVKLADKTYKGMLNIGVRPTVGNDCTRSIEVHILHFSGDIYRQTIRIEFVERIRDERRFDNVSDLSAQLQKDAEQVDKLLNDKEME